MFFLSILIRQMPFSRKKVFARKLLKNKLCTCVKIWIETILSKWPLLSLNRHKTMVGWWNSFFQVLLLRVLFLIPDILLVQNYYRSSWNYISKIDTIKSAATDQSHQLATTPNVSRRWPVIYTTFLVAILTQSQL